MKKIIIMTAMSLSASLAMADVAPEIPAGQKTMTGCVKYDMSAVPDYVLLRLVCAGKVEIYPGGRGESCSHHTLAKVDLTQCAGPVTAMSVTDWKAFEPQSTKMGFAVAPKTVHPGISEFYESVQTKGQIRTWTYKAAKSENGQIVFNKVSTVDSERKAE